MERQSNHDALVRLIVNHLGSIKHLKSEALEVTGRRYVARLTFKRAMETATRYLLDHDIINWQQEIINDSVSICEGGKPITEEHNPSRGKTEST